ncbi:hypothetical protein ACNRWW_18160 [Metabacillus sp. HB246100]
MSYSSIEIKDMNLVSLVELKRRIQVDLAKVDLRLEETPRDSILVSRRSQLAKLYAEVSREQHRRKLVSENVN